MGADGGQLITIMRYLFLSRTIKNARERVGGPDCISANAVSFPSHDASFAARKVSAAIIRLPPHFREALVLVFLMGESYQDVAHICGCAIGTIKSRISRARKMIIEDLGITSADELITVCHRETNSHATRSQW